MILVTGGSGFIGSNLIHGWLERHDEPLINVDKLTYAGNPQNVAACADDPRYRFVRADINDRSVIGGLLEAHRPRAILNLAAESHVDRSIHGADAFIRTNVSGTFALLETVTSYWRDLPTSDQNAFRFLHVSTDEVYGTLSASDAPFTEESRYQPNSPYSATKAASDHLVRAWHHTHGLPVLTTNCSNNYGPYQFPEKLIPLVICNALAGQTLPIYGDGQQIRDWLFVADHCRAIERVLEQGRLGEVYNIGGWNEQSNLTVVRTICDLLDDMRPRPDGRPYAEQIAFVRDRPGHDRRYAIDAAKMKRELDWSPSETFASGIRRTIAWYLANPDWIADVTSGSYRDWVDSHYGT